jgi:hypothetical protein
MSIKKLNQKRWGNAPAVDRTDHRKTHTASIIWDSNYMNDAEITVLREEWARFDTQGELTAMHATCGHQGSLLTGAYMGWWINCPNEHADRVMGLIGEVYARTATALAALPPPPIKYRPQRPLVAPTVAPACVPQTRWRKFLNCLPFTKSTARK